MFNKPIVVVCCVLAGFCLSQLFSDRATPEAQAMTAHGTDKKTMVTVPLEAGMEAVVTLDHQTGDMTGYVLDRLNGQFFIQYRYNVNADFPPTHGGYLMATGLVDFRSFQGNDRLASGVVYVSEESSGQVVAYGLPWNTQLRASNAQPQRFEFISLDKAQTRFTQLR